MRTLNSCSGPWAGFWIQDGFRGCQKLELGFGVATVSGCGDDPAGHFIVSGSYAGESVDLVKRYLNYRVHYSGTWDGKVLYGTWRMRLEDFRDSGTFEIWPLDEEQTIESFVLDEEMASTRSIVEI